NQALSWINGIDRSSSPYINDTLKQENISINDLVYFGSLRTERYQFKDETITYVLDKSTYNYTTDYELEIEATNYDDGKRVFQSLLKTHKIVEKKTVTKIERFFTTR